MKKKNSKSFWRPKNQVEKIMNMHRKNGDDGLIRSFYMLQATFLKSSNFDEMLNRIVS